MGHRQRDGRVTIEGLLRASSAEAPDELVDRLVARTEGSRAARVPLLARAAVLSGAIVAALGMVGGIGYAASIASKVATQVKAHSIYMGTQATVPASVKSAADDQYGNPEPTSPGEGGERSDTSGPGDDGAFVVTAPGADSSTVISWPAATFTAPVVIKVDPTPPLTNTAIVGTGNQLISITITDQKTGAAVHELAAPIEIVFKSTEAGFVPVVSDDGINFRALKRLAGTTLPADQADGYYIDGAGDVHVVTRHVTVFAVLFKANVNVSESGRKTPQAGSGLFGDPTRNHVGAPVVQRAGAGAAAKRVAGGSTIVTFTLLIDEQASLTLGVFDAAGKQAVISRSRSTVRGSRQTGGPVKNFKVVVKRPGTLTFSLAIPRGQLVPGATWKTYRVRAWAVDFDGNRTVRYLTFKA